ncbi:hypothetical protein MASR2M78_27110 [Treponema sp.]
MKKFLVFLRPLILDRRTRNLFYILILLGIAFVSFISSGNTRRTFVFISLRRGSEQVEERMLPRWGSREALLARYVEEYLLGPASVDQQRLFPKGSHLSSLILREGQLFLNLSEEAAIPVEGESNVQKSISLLSTGLLRNFTFVKQVSLFIDGREPYSHIIGTSIASDAPKNVKSVDK